MANYRNPLNPAAVNFNPMLRQQKDLALRPTDMGGFGFQQDDIGRFLGSADPDSDDYNPLLGQNLVSLFGTNDLLGMLRKRRAKLQGYDYESETKTKKLKEIDKLINQGVIDESAGYTGDPKGQIGSGVFAKMDQSGKTYGPYTPQGNQGNQGNTSSSGHKAPGGSGYGPHKRADGGLATMFTRRR